MKTASQIEGDVYKCTQGLPIRGKVYRDGYRPDNSNTEDAVVVFSSGDDSQIQTGIIKVNIYVPDILVNGKTVKDGKRIEEVEKMLFLLFSQLENYQEYEFSSNSTAQTFKAEGINQHFVNFSLKYKLINL